MKTEFVSQNKFRLCGGWSYASCSQLEKLSMDGDETAADFAKQNQAINLRKAVFLSVTFQLQFVSIQQ